MSPRRFSIWVCLLLLFCFIWGGFPGAAAGEGKTIRIGFPQALKTEDNRNLTELRTYAISYLDELAKQTDWKYEYYTAPYDICRRMLEQDEIDFMFPVEYDEKNDAGFIPTEGYSCYTLLSLYVREADDRFLPGTDPVMSGRSIGLLDNENHQKQFSYYRKKNHWELSTRVYPSREALVEALGSGEVDAIVDNGNQDMPGIRLLVSFATQEACFITTAEKQELADAFNLAIQTSQVTNPDFETWLERQYLDPVMHRLAAYTGPERDLIRRLPSLRMVFVRSIPPLVESGKEGIRGIYPDILRQLSNDSGLTFEFIEASSMKEATRMIDDGIADMTLAVYNREAFRQGMFFTNSIWTDALSIVARKDEEILFETPMQIAIPEWMHGAREYIQRRHSNWTILEYSDVDACLYSVSQNICTLAMIPQTVLHYEDTLLTYPSLQRITAPDSHANLPVCIAISANQPRLLQEIVDKAILHMNSEVLNQIVQQNMSRRRLSLRFFLSRYPLYTAGAIIFFVLGGAVTAFFAYFARMKNQQAKTLNEKNEELQTAFRALDEKNNELQMALRARNSAQREAETDTLTGLLTRVVIENVCKHFLTEADEGTTFAFFIVDLDHFKEVNDTYGHQAGDAILKDFSQALLRIFRRTDCVGRFGGDEFVIFAPYITKSGDIERLCRQILEAARSLSVPDGSHPVSASIGIALAPAHGRTYQTVFHAADTALYRVKEDGRNGFAIYRPEMANNG